MKGDTVVEANETFYVNLSSATNATIADNQGIGTIVNDDGAPQQSRHLQRAFELVREGSGYAIRITDTGGGIPEEARPHIFERFYRADKVRSRCGGGAGLGLSIASWIAEAHGGRVALERCDETGSTFLVSLPSSAEAANI